MQISGLVVEGVGRFGLHAMVNDIGKGVNVLAAGNEAGKSTLFRALRACIFERHTAKNESLRALQNYNTNLPVTVSVSFTNDGHAYTITKSFLRSVSASFVVDGREIAKNAEADQMLWELLGIQPGSGRAVDEGAFAMLWVGQGHSFSAPVPTEAGATVLGSAIESEVGSLVGGERARIALAETVEELGKYVTEKTGKPLAEGPIGRVQRDRDSYRNELNSSLERLRQLDTQFNELYSAQEERKRIANPADRALLQQNLTDAIRELDEAREAVGKVAAQEADERRLHVQLDNARRAYDYLVEISDHVNEQRERESALATQIHDIEIEEKRLRLEVSSLRSAVSDLDKADQALLQESQVLTQLIGAASQFKLKSEMEHRHAILTEIVERLTKAEAGLSALKITAAQIQALEKIDRTISLIDAKLASSASLLAIKLGPESDTEITLNGLVVNENTSLSVTAPLRIGIGKAATIEVSPPSDFGEADEKVRAAHITEQQRVFAAADISTLAEGRIALNKKETIKASIQGIGAELRSLGVVAETPHEELIRLAGEISRIVAETEQAISKADMDKLPALDVIEKRREVISEEREKLLVNRKKLSSALNEVQPPLESAVSGKAAIEGKLGELRRNLAANLIVSPDATRHADIATAKTAMDTADVAHQQSAGALGDIRSRSPNQSEMERLTNKLKRLEQANFNLGESIAGIDKKISNLEGQIQNAGGDGVGERVSGLKELVELSELDLSRHVNRARTLTLLKDTINSSLNESRDRFYTPIRRHLQPFLNDLFPGAELQLGDGFSVDGLKRSGASEEFEYLSEGTKEQIAVLVRLAMGALLAEQGKAVPIILDDALVFSDDDRIARMFDALIRAGKHQQVIVLTCRSRAFTSLGGHLLSITTASK